MLAICANVILAGVREATADIADADIMLDDIGSVMFVADGIGPPVPIAIMALKSCGVTTEPNAATGGAIIPF